ncbi:MAG TPA: hypothetical protein VIL65_16185 [Beijerinckiaceae bacterium]
MLARTGALALLGCGIAFVAATMLPPPAPAQAAAPVAAVATTPESGKDAVRLAAWNGPLAPREASLPVTPRGSLPEPATAWSLLDARPAGPQDAARFEAAPAARLDAAAFTPRPAPDWREEEFPQVTAFDGRTLLAGSTRIRLAGLDLPAAEEACRTLDGRLEPCRERAATVLDLTTRHRRVTCRHRPNGAESVGTCRIGESDLAERLLRAGYVRRDAASPESPSRG